MIGCPKWNVFLFKYLRYFQDVLWLCELSFFPPLILAKKIFFLNYSYETLNSVVMFNERSSKMWFLSLSKRKFFFIRSLFCISRICFRKTNKNVFIFWGTRSFVWINDLEEKCFWRRSGEVCWFWPASQKMYKEDLMFRGDGFDLCTLFFVLLVFLTTGSQVNHYSVFKPIFCNEFWLECISHFLLKIYISRICCCILT